MNELIDKSKRVSEELSITFHFSDGEKFTQTLPIDSADAAQDVTDWFRDPKGQPVWTWRHPSNARVQMIPRSQVTFIEINGFMDLMDGRESKWFHRLFDKLKVKIYLSKRWWNKSA